MIRKRLRKASIVLMYHRIAEAEADPWDLCVSPKNFKEQLEVLTTRCRVLSVSQLVGKEKRKFTRRRPVVVLTFDDGYIDNYKNALPSLEAFNAPGCFFIASENMGKQQEYWWDELERLLLHTTSLPELLQLQINGELFMYRTDPYAFSHLVDYLPEGKDVSSLPNLDLYLQLWKRLRPLPYATQQTILEQLRKWAGAAEEARPEYRCMSAEQLKHMAQSPLSEIGVHTVHHPALADHSKQVQQLEILENRKWLEQITGRPMNYCAYPYGSYNADTLALMKQEGFQAAFTTKPHPVGRKDDPYQIGRFQVRNWDGADFEKQLYNWLNV